MTLFEMLAAGGDAATIGIVLILWKLDKRVTRLEWAGERVAEQAKNSNQ